MAGENQSPIFKFLFFECLLNAEPQEVLFLLFYSIVFMRELGPILLFQIGQYIPCVWHCFHSLCLYVEPCYFSQILHTLTPILAAVNIVPRYFSSASTLTEQISQVSVVFDTYRSVCHPLWYYSIIMSRRTCGHLIMAIFSNGFLSMVKYTVSTSELFFFDSNILSCPDPQILSIASLDTCPPGSQLFIIGTLSFASSLLMVLISYVCFLAVFFKILPSKRRLKAFSSCVSHLIASLFYETSLFEWVT
ncbi:olfactory receptor 1030-like [Gracilinanus agilis]|uniref:olfactory receptor 1030-like n=1 Tax=Gracilinanus agilis TaxID=191870 RepID=UPI001CFCB750|nr:olfactory receptor 1030-like [Gracilinanus agilis]